jgi:hypothetical protein
LTDYPQNGSTGKLPDETSLANIRTIEQIMLQDNLPVGNALMKVLGVTWTDGNSVETQMRGVSLSLLHTSILSWLAFDIIEDKNAFNRQPCVFSMKIALEVQRDLADDSMCKWRHTARIVLTTYRIPGSRPRGIERISIESSA